MATPHAGRQLRLDRSVTLLWATRPVGVHVGGGGDAGQRSRSSCEPTTNGGVRQRCPARGGVGQHGWRGSGAGGQQPQGRGGKHRHTLWVHGRGRGWVVGEMGERV